MRILLLKLFVLMVAIVTACLIVGRLVIFTPLNSEMHTAFFEGKLKIEDFISEYFVQLNYNIMYSTLIFLMTITFSWLVNSWIISDKFERKSMKKISFFRRIILFFFTFEIVLLLRVFIVFTSIFLSFDYSSLRGNIFLILLYIPVTIFIRKNWTCYYEGGKNRLIFLAYGPLILSSFLTLAIKIKYFFLDWDLIFGIFILTLVFIEMAVLLFWISMRLFQLDLSFARKGKLYIIYQYNNESTKLSEILKDYIRKRNRINLEISIYLYIILFLYVFVYSIFIFIGLLDELKTAKFFIDGLWFFTLVLLIRLLSRSIEIVHSFVKDVTSKRKKRSNLDGKDRMLLAIKSLVEITIIAAIIRVSHSLNLNLKSDCNTFFSVIEPSNLISVFIENTFLSIATTAFNISFNTSEFDLIRQITHLTQLLVSISLITLSIATYISFDKSNK